MEIDDTEIYATGADAAAMRFVIRTPSTAREPSSARRLGSRRRHAHGVTGRTYLNGNLVGTDSTAIPDNGKVRRRQRRAYATIAAGLATATYDDTSVNNGMTY